MIRLKFSRQADVGSACIGIFSAGHVSHVDVVGDDGRLFGARSDTIHCEDGSIIKPGVRWRPHDYHTWPESFILQYQVLPEVERIFWAFLRAQEGLPYDHWAIWAFIMWRDWREPDSWICSELVTAALERCGVFKRAVVRANKVTPVALSFAASVVGFTRFAPPSSPTDQTFPIAP